MRGSPIFLHSKKMDFSLYFLDGGGNLGDAVVGETPIYPAVPIVTTRGGIRIYTYIPANQ